MTVLFMDSLDVYSVSADMRTGNRWDVTNTTSAWSSTAGARGGGGFTSTGGTLAFINLGTIHNVLVVGFWWKFSAAPSASRAVIRFSRASATTNIQVYLALNTSRQLIVLAGDATTVIAAGTTVLTANTWYHIEIKYDIQNVGAYTVMVNGASELSGSADLQFQASSGADWISAGSGAVNITQTFDDVYVLNTSGSAPTNDLLGITYIDALVPTSDDSVTALASSGTDKYAMLDETIPDGTTTYTSQSSNAADRYGFSDLASPSFDVYAAQVTSVMKQDEVTPARTARNIITSNGNTSNGSTRNLTNVFAWWSDIVEIDPDGSVQWTYTSINAATGGTERVS